MRMNYRVYRADYVNKLKRIDNNRKKAMAFMDYTDDVDMGNVNSIGFYADAWYVSKRTAWKWIKEFKENMEFA